MSVEAITWALNADVGDSTRKLVLIGYANHAHKDGRNSWASKDTIAEYANCHVKTVRRHVRELVAAGWMREGDQKQVSHLRADRRPVVYDVAMTEAQRLEWATASPVDNPPVESLVRGDSLSGRAPGHGGTDGGTPVGARGDTAVSPEPSRTRELPPQPPAERGERCAKPGPTPHRNCRGCGTTNKQLAAQRRREGAERARAAEVARLAAERQRVASSSRPAAEVPDLVSRIRLEHQRATVPRLAGGDR